MNDIDLNFSKNLLKMQNDFDQVFASPIETKSLEFINLLTFKFGEDYFALKTTEITGLFRNKKVIPLPSDDAPFLGMAGIQGQLVPVYNLASFLGYKEFSMDDSSWLIVCGQKEPIGLMFNHLEGYIQLPQSELVNASKTDKSNEHASGAIHFDSKVGYMLSISSILNVIKRKTGISVAMREE